ncbi:MAG: ABC transporter permease [Deinococcus sp.]|nr:ABC transporter permease [Deinococcus sp.]
MTLFGLELLKLRRTLVWPVVWLLPLIPAALDAFIFRTERMLVTADWDLMLQNGMTSWWLLLTPLFISLLTAQILGLEHSSGGWRLAFSAPLERQRILWTKLALLGALLTLATGLVALTVSAGALTLGGSLRGEPDWGAFIHSVLLGLGGAWARWH